MNQNLPAPGTGEKSWRLANATPSLQDGYARVERGELWLYGVHIPPLPQASYRNHEPVRTRNPVPRRDPDDAAGEAPARPRAVRTVSIGQRAR